MKLASILIVVLLISTASAITIKDIVTGTLSPGREGILEITIENTFDKDVDDVSLSLDLTQVPITAISSSEFSVKEIEEDEEERFVFKLKASPNAQAGDYKIPYTITSPDLSTSRKGTFGIRITASSELTFTVNTENPIIGQTGKVNLRIVNSGLGDALFVSFTIVPDGFTLLSEDSTYIGTIDSDDFETESFDVIFNSKFSSLSGILEYRDVENKKYTQAINLQLVVYTKEEAINLGITPMSNTPLYLGITIVLIVAWIVWRIVKRRRRMKRSMQK